MSVRRFAMAEPKRNFKMKAIILAICFIVVFLGFFMLGKYPIMPDELIKILLSKIFHIMQTWPEEAETVIFNIRLPRVIAACMIGAALAVAGVSYQGMFQNPMVFAGSARSIRSSTTATRRTGPQSHGRRPTRGRERSSQEHRPDDNKPKKNQCDVPAVNCKF